MRKVFLTIIAVLFLITSAAIADEVSIQWIAVDDVHCAGYIVQTSLDMGQTWTDATETGDPMATHAVITDLPSDAMVFFRVVTVNANGDRFPRAYSGAWYDGRLKPVSDPAGAGIR